MTINVQALVGSLKLGAITTYYGRAAVVVRVKGIKTIRMLGEHPVSVPPLNDGRTYQFTGWKGSTRDHSHRGKKYVAVVEQR